MVQLDGGRFATSDLNDLYRRVINRNNRLKRLLELGAPEIIVRNEKRMLQESVDALIDNSRRGRPVTGAGNRPLKSLSDLLKGKQGRFRQNLLGKRVDYSGRSVIVVGPELKIYQCGLPKEMAIELFKPFVMKELVERHLAHNIKSAKRMVERLSPEVWGILEEVIKDHPVMLNRAPTLHRLGIQSFEPVLVEGRAIKLHALVCEAFNADFDGDQMAIHLPLTPEAQAESRYLMLATNNLLKPQDGKPVAVPRLDMILGSYYLTMTLDGELGEGKYFKDPDEAIMALQNNAVSIHAKIFVRITKEIDGEMKSKKVETSVGRIIFNQGIPQDLGFIDRKEDPFQYEINFPVMKKSMGTIIERTIDKHGLIESAEVIDYIKALGFKYSTLAGITFSVADVKVPDSKKDILADADKQVEKVRNQYRRGLITDDERYQSVVNIWEKATNDVSKAMEENFDDLNPIYMMVKSGARGNMNQLRQIAGMRGLMASTTGKAVEIPIKSCFREGLDALEYFISSHGARKGLSDTALRTADSGYLTRRLVDVSQDIIVREHDCGTVDGLTIEDIKDGNQIVEGLAERLEGRYPLNDILDPQTNEVIVDTNTMINKDIAKRIVDAGITKVVVRSVIACRGKHGVCQKCYGMGLARRDLVSIGESVGIIAAQSIGEPGTQLTMRTIHSGGVAGVADITQGLPRVEEIFEARKPKGVAVITEIDGTVKISDNKKKLEVIVTSKDDSRTYTIPFGSKLKVKDGDEVKAADPLIEGSINPAEILAIKGPEGVYEYVISEIQKAYRNQGVDINDKHVEVIARQMLRKVRVDDGGDTDMFPGSLVDMYEFEDKNKEAVEQGKRPATGKRALLGITKASLATDSFLSAASFQETTRVLTEAAIKGKEDDLIGLKENVIIGKLIPAGTGMKRYQDVTIKVEGEDEKTVAEEIDANKQVETQSDAE
jgi:DNA-directed RNA polymerase, beta' subunit